MRLNNDYMKKNNANKVLTYLVKGQTSNSKNK